MTRTTSDVPRGTPVSYAVEAARYAGHPLSDVQIAQLEQYARWLEAEAIPAGGLGPREAERIWSRHIADSLTFAVGWPQAPGELLDVGTGVGLPGIPLAVAFPDTAVTLLDRGGRRIRLLHRAVRMLNLGNVVIAQGDALSVADEWGGLVFRASIPPPEAIGLANRILEPGAIAVLGLSTREEEPDRAQDLISLASALGLEAEIHQIPRELLDGTSWLLIMRS
ncbi:MAG: class I SAM-dependent methyltransferase [Acidimicrobiia bacterium]|nr:class I SAM-dependent methyltransferase [Acidimicrobiia bacterium]